MKEMNSTKKVLFSALNEQKNLIFIGFTTRSMQDRKDADFRQANSMKTKKFKNSREYLEKWQDTDPSEWEYFVIDDSGDMLQTGKKLFGVLKNIADKKMDIVKFPYYSIIPAINTPDELRELIEIKNKLKFNITGLNNENDYKTMNQKNKSNDAKDREISAWPLMLRNQLFNAQDGDYAYKDVFNLYNVKIEEESFLPITYLRYYPTQLGEYTDDDWKNYWYIQGLKYIVQAEYLSDDPKKIKRNNLKGEHFKEYGSLIAYARDFETLLNSKYSGPIILTSIPSSKVGKINMVERIIQLLSIKNSRFIDGRKLISKQTNEVAAHESKITRSISTHMESWNKMVDFPDKWLDYPVVVMDDVVTSGSSFDAADIHLIENMGFDKHDIVNFAFGKTYPNIFVNTSTKLDKKEFNTTIVKADQTFTKIIFDLDHTLFDNDYKYLNNNGEYYLDHSISNLRLIDVSLVQKIFDLLNERGIEYAFVTHRGRGAAEKMLNTFGPSMHLKDDYLLRTTTDFRDKYERKTSEYYKPSPVMIEDVIKEWNKTEQVSPANILGIGNSETDIMAYLNAGIYSLLSTAGNRILKRNTCHANAYISDLDSLYKFLSVHTYELDSDLI